MPFSAVPRIALAAALICLPVPPASAQQSAQGQEEAQHVVVTARRSGIPVWRVSSPTTTIVLVGAIDRIAKGTRWNPEPLTDALLKANRVMFPETVQVSASPFAMVGYLMRWRRHATLPKGQSLSQMLAPREIARLAELRKRRLLGAGYERKHPFHLALQLQEIAKGKQGYGPSTGQFVTRTVKKHKLRLVPFTTGKVKPLAEELFASSPASHVPCLVASLAMAEAGPAAMRARSDAWAARRVPQVLASPVEEVERICWPAAARNLTPTAPLAPAVRRLLAEPKVTLAVISLASLARPGGVLDDLKAAGYQVSGPAWR